MRTAIVLLFLSLILCASAQQEYVKELVQLREASLQADDDRIQKDLNDKFSQRLSQFIKEEKVAFSDLDSLPYFAVLPSPDKKFTLLNWNLNHSDRSYTYYGLVYPKKSLDPIPLTDGSEGIVSPETKVFTHKNWYGALYYEIIPVKARGDRYYVLLGWDGNNVQTTKKIIDLCYFTKNGITFGKPVFHQNGTMKNRVVFEFAKSAVMSIRYHKKKDMIIFDHLSPIYEGADGLYEFYAPDLSFDAYELSKNEWHYVKDVDVRAPNTMKNYIEPKTN